jgi:serine/threonine protein phosphatase PrpC
MLCLSIALIHSFIQCHLLRILFRSQTQIKIFNVCCVTKIDILNLGKKRYLFAVFDGHGGNQVAEFVRDNFVNELKANKNYINEKYEDALTETFIKMDSLMRADDGDVKLNQYTKKEGDSGGFEGYSGMDSSSNIAICCGCTACVVLIVGDTIYCANAGDSRCVLSQNKSEVPLSYDHKPSNPEEEERIKRAGGYVSFDRVNGNLNLSRALGDFTYKEKHHLGIDEQMVLCIPDVRSAKIDEKTDFFIIACDGIWDCMTNKKSVEYIHSQIETMNKGTRDFKISDINSAIFDRNCAKDTTTNEGVG